MNLVNGLVTLPSLSLYHYRSFSLSRNKKNKLETVPLKNPNKKSKINNLSRSQVFVAHSLWVICRNVSRSFVELCMETPYWCTNMAAGNENIWSSLFLEKLFLFTQELAYVHINISSNTWNGYTAENQEERLFFSETAFQFWCHALWKLQIAVFAKWNMLRDWKVVQRFIVLFIFNLV